MFDWNKCKKDILICCMKNFYINLIVIRRIEEILNYFDCWNVYFYIKGDIIYEELE